MIKPLALALLPYRHELSCPRAARLAISNLSPFRNAGA
jgi:hypothetical protein